MIDLAVGSTVALPKSAFNNLLAALRAVGYQTIGPSVRDSAVVYAPISGLEDLPRGYVSVQSPGEYRLEHRGHPRYFDFTPGADTWKRFLFPPRSTLFRLMRENGRWREAAVEAETPRYALIGVRPCELAAIQVQDRVFLREDFSDPIYQTRRRNLFLLVVNCLNPGGTCFCVSMGTGPQAQEGFDLALTELDDVFLLEVGSEAGRMALDGLPWEPATAFWLQTAREGLAAARERMGRRLDNVDAIPARLQSNLEHPRWDDVARRCLSCGNCTQVCPTCFCWNVEDITNLSRTETRRERVWDSCFNPDYAYQAGGNARPAVRSRYRQWLIHKFSTWKDQFGTLGCVGCGRCITWCPVGIDVTEEVQAIAQQEVRA